MNNYISDNGMKLKLLWVVDKHMEKERDALLIFASIFLSSIA